MQEYQEKRSGLGLLGYIWNEWISTFIILILLLMTLIIGTGEMIHGQLLRIGERLYDIVMYGFHITHGLNVVFCQLF